MPTRILIFREKHCDQHFVVPTLEDEAKVHLHILRQRIEEDYWYDGEDKDKAVAATVSPQAAKRFLSSRRECEYEGYHTTEALDASDLEE